VGFAALICGLLALFNVLLIISGILIIVAGGVCDTIWGRVRRARRVTGFPWRGVATSLGGRWHSKLTCRFCGAPLVVLSAIGNQHLVLVNTICPLDKVTEQVKLPLAWMDGWIDAFRDRLHRCMKCGERTESLRASRQGRQYTRLRPHCSQHRTSAQRRIWSPLYSHIAARPEVDVGFRSQQAAPRRLHPSHRVYQTRGVSTVRVVTPDYPSPRKSTSRGGASRRFCSECGVRIELGDQYCYRCGFLLH
jgi:hypothetical protein